ncbi:MAG: methylenetetrahydrofolate reductase C-terminal domain-containing protein [Candidatus Kaelpia aquatica]|nr:methylenetetrahydrofolate reductase C-terminal domain-containing protein [Candidatus Kaelpia aquatica]
MIITEQKNFDQISKHLKRDEKIFIVGCGECSTVCKTGGEKEVLEIRKRLEDSGFVVTGYAVPQAPCIAAELKRSLSKHSAEIRESNSYLLLSCGLGVQSLIENANIDLDVHIGCNTLFAGTVSPDSRVFFESCSACGDCILEYTGGICPLTQCSKGILNGPCGGMEAGKCELDKERDCIWVSIYRRLKEKGKLDLFERFYKARDFSKHRNPMRRILK